MGFDSLLLKLLIISTITATSTAQTPPVFKCNTTTTCHALIDYVLLNTTSLSSIKTLFQIKNFRTLLGSNGLPTSTSPNSTLPASLKIKIPFPCLCTNGTGISNHRPIYTVKPGDDLDHIAVDVFSRLVTYQEIAAVNGIPDPNKIIVGQKLWIPLPCSCDEVEGVRVVHYGYLVQPGNSVAGIARDFNVSEIVLSGLNGNVNDSTLIAGNVLDVPLKACTSSIRSDSQDYPLLVANGTYVYTANNCVKCNCDAANNWTLQCEPSQIKPSVWSTCPATQCNPTTATGLFLGNSSSSSGCNSTVCAYAGYSNQTIFTDLATLSTCPVSENNAGPGNSAAKIGMQGLCWNYLVLSSQLLLLGLFLL